MSKIIKIEDAFKHEIEVIDSNFPDEPEVMANIKNKIKEYGEIIRKATLEEASRITNSYNGNGMAVINLEKSDILKIE